MPPTTRTPVDPAPTPDDGDAFVFEHAGQRYQLSPTLATLTPGYVRRFRALDPNMFNLQLFEDLAAGADPDPLDAFDAMTWVESGDLMRAFDAHQTAVLRGAVGESGRSSTGSTSTPPQ